MELIRTGIIPASDPTREYYISNTDGLVFDLYPELVASQQRRRRILNNPSDPQPNDPSRVYLEIDGVPFDVSPEVAEGYILKVIDLSPQARTSLGLLLHTQASLQDQQVSGSI